jgi:FdhD protein
LKKEHSCLKLDGERLQNSIDSIVEETPLSLFINGRHFVTAMISPDMVTEFILGYLFSERIINSRSDVESLEFEGQVAWVIIAHPIKALVPRKPIVSGCGGTAAFLDQSKLPKIASDMRIDKKSILSALKATLDSELHAATGGVHSVGLFEDDKAICICEDIGRHNALDKAIGFGLGRDVDFGRLFVVSTGRISSEMALKCCVAGIPLIASRGATTSLAVEIAERAGLSIIGFVRGDRMNIYSNRWRVKEASKAISEADS